MQETRPEVIPFQKIQYPHIRLKLLSHFDLSNPWTYTDYINSLELALLQINDFFYKLTFEGLDHNNDGYISEVDLFLFLKEIRDDSLLKILSFDLSKIIDFISQKKKAKGTDDDIKYRFEMLTKKLAKMKRDALMSKTKKQEEESKSNNFFEFLTQALTSHAGSQQPTAENSPNRSMSGDSPSPSPKGLRRFGQANRFESSKINFEENAFDSTKSSFPGFTSGGRPKKKNQFDLVYAYSEKDKSIEKISLEEFMQIDFTYPVPNLMIDFIKYLTGHDMYKLHTRVMQTPNFEHLDFELGSLKIRIGKTAYGDLVAGFLKLCHNPEVVLDSQWYITQDSMHRNFKSIFCEYNKYFCNVFYYYLSKGKEKIKIPLAQFAQIMHSFLSEDKTGIMDKTFYFYDTNQDGMVSMLDLLHASAFVPCDSQFGQEIHTLREKYMDMVVLSRKRRKIYDITKELFPTFLDSSCIISELLTKLFNRSCKGWPTIQAGSIFSRQKTISEADYEQKMNFYHKTYSDLYDSNSSDVIGKTYDRVNRRDEPLLTSD